MMNRTNQARMMLLAGLCLVAAPAIAQQPPPAPPRRPAQSPVERNAAATELPVSPWGPYARSYSGPCFLADRAKAQMFAFPIVVGQRRMETMLRPMPLANGKTRQRSERVAIERRSLGLAPIQAWDDDRLTTEAGTTGNRVARIREADGSGTYWSTAIHFADAALAQNVLATADATGKIAAPAPWGAADATVSYFPANVDPTGDGLLVRVTLTNHSPLPQTYFVDLLGGIEGASQTFPAADLLLESDPNTDNLIIRHRQAPVVFALAGNAKTYPQRTYRVGSAYFTPEGAVSVRSAIGAALPGGLLTADSPAAAAPAKIADGKPASSDAKWGLLRVDDILLQPEETATIVLCVGVGKDGEGASDAAQTLLSQCEDILPDGMRRKGDGLATKALAAHKAARFNSGSEVFDRLMAQSLLNTPNYDLRRVGVPSRHETGGVPGGIYQPENGGWLALAWSQYRPDWSAAQLNAYFLTEGDATVPVSNPQAIVPTNIFALWELYQRTHDRAMLARFYPFAKRRYRELLTAGRTDETGLYAWPVHLPRPELALAGMPAVGPAPATPADLAARACTPDYSAYVIRVAKILHHIAEETKQPIEEIQKYAQDASNATIALNEKLWDMTHDTYVARPLMPMLPVRQTDRLRDVLPLMAGGDAIPAMQRADLIRHLADPAAYWSGVGLRSLSKDSPHYHSGSPQEGAVSFGENYLLWKALLDAGEAETAQKLAENLLHAYTAQSALAGFPEGLDSESGTAFGTSDYTGDSCALLVLQAAYHTTGTVSVGWDIDMVSQHYDHDADTLRLGWRSLDITTSGTLLCMMGKPNGKYRLSGALTGLITADANGLLTLTTPRDTTTQSLEINPL